MSRRGPNGGGGDRLRESRGYVKGRARRRVYCVHRRLLQCWLGGRETQKDRLFFFLTKFAGSGSHSANSDSVSMSANTVSKQCMSANLRSPDRYRSSAQICMPGGKRELFLTIQYCRGYHGMHNVIVMTMTLSLFLFFIRMTTLLYRTQIIPCMLALSWDSDSIGIDCLPVQ